MSNPADALIRDLLVLALCAADSKSAIRARRDLTAANERAWQICLTRMEEHRLLPLVWYGLLRHDCAQRIPDHIGAILQSRFEGTRAMNSVSLMALRQVAEAASLKGVSVTACKGIVLAAEYYPSLGARPMDDIDLWILPRERTSCAEAMHSNGFVRNEAICGPNADYFENGMGVVFDVHAKMELFAAQFDALKSLTRTASDGHWRVFEPHALLAHLIVHMCSHAEKMGPMILWMVDLWFVLRKVWQEVDPLRLCRLLRSTSEWIFLLRTMRMLELLADEPSPAVLSPFLADVAPADLNALWRERRLATWALPRPIGWARLAACGLRLKDPRGRYYPLLGDLAHWPVDRLGDWLAFEKARRSSATLPV